MKQEIGQLELEYRRDLNLLISRWTKPVSSSEELKENYEHIQELVCDIKANLFLIDTRRRGFISQEDEAWIMEVFFPAVEQLLPGIHHYAYLVTPSIKSHIQQDVGIAKLENLRTRTKIKVFDVEKEAINWLRTVSN